MYRRCPGFHAHASEIFDHPYCTGICRNIINLSLLSDGQQPMIVISPIIFASTQYYSDVMHIEVRWCVSHNTSIWARTHADEGNEKHIPFMV